MMLSDKLRYIVSCLPVSARDELMAFADKTEDNTLEEIRIRAESPICYRCDGALIFGDCVISEAQLGNIVKSLCEDSVYSHSDEIRNGYISVYGMRIGVCGEAVSSFGKTEDIKRITSLNIRLPYISKDLAISLAEHIKNSGYSESVLVYSPPGTGKTSVLRSLCALLSSKPYSKNIALCDPRGELYDNELMRGCMCDAYINYPLDRALELAVRTMCPDYIICDEIGGKSEMNALLSCAYMGVPIVASAHADDIFGLCRRSNIKPLIDMGVFNSFVRLRRRGKRISFDYLPLSEARAV